MAHDGHHTEEGHSHHGHHHGHDHSHDHHHDHASENRISELVASAVSENFRDWVRENNANIIMLGTVPLYLGLTFANRNPLEGVDLPLLGRFGEFLLGEYGGVLVDKFEGMLGQESLLNENPWFATGLTFAAPFAMYDIHKNFMKAADQLEADGIISARTTSGLGAFMHSGSEIISAMYNASKAAIVSSFNGAAAGDNVRRALSLNLSSTFWSGLSHYGTMFFGGAAFWRVGFASNKEWWTHAKGITGITAGLGVPVVADAAVQAIPNEGWSKAANVVNRAVGAFASYKYSTKYMRESAEYGNECMTCGTNHTKTAVPKAEESQTFRQRMTQIPKTAKLILTHPAGKDVIKSTGSLIILSGGMLYNIDTLSQGFALATAAQGRLHELAHSTPETLFMFMALASGRRDMAIGTLSGCVASIGVLGSVLIASGADIAESLRSTMSMAAYLSPPALALAASQEDFMRWAGKYDEIGSQWVKRRLPSIKREWWKRRAVGVSNWLSNDGRSVARWVAVPAAAAAVAATMMLSAQNCHTHLDGTIDCGNVQTPEIIWN